MYNITVPQFIKVLTSTSNYFDKLIRVAEQKKFDPNLILQCRLSPDQWPFVKQIQTVCDTAKGTAARLTGQTPPKHEDNETTVQQLRERVDKTVAYLKTFKPSDFDGSEERKVDIFFLPGKWLPGFEYVTEMALPNFYFHLTTAYAILRHNGVDLGKMDYLGPVNFRG